VALNVPLQMTGSVQPIDSRVTHVRPLARGRIQDVKVKIGDRVEGRQELATFDNIEAGELATQYDAAQAELSRTRAQLTAATRQAERVRTLLGQGVAAQKELEAAQADQQQLEASVRGQQATLAGMEARLRRYGVSASSGDRQVVSSIRAPFSGVVTRVAAAPGDVVDSSSDLFAVADISRVYVQAQVYEKDLARVRTGQSVTIVVDAYPDQRFTGRVAAIGDVVDPQTRTIAVRCEVANPQRQLKLDMLARIELATAATTPVLALPSDAVQSVDDKPVVFVKSGDQFSVRAVEVGPTSASMVAITSGLKAGDIVVTRGAFQVKSALLSKGLGEKDKDQP
jgi:cobalt-zinc-cadmium efflux system membrane fusion protein